MKGRGGGFLCSANLRLPRPSATPYKGVGCSSPHHLCTMHPPKGLVNIAGASLQMLSTELLRTMFYLQLFLEIGFSLEVALEGVGKGSDPALQHACQSLLLGHHPS